MDERSVLEAQIVGLEQELSRAKVALLKIDPELSGRLEVRFSKLFNDQTKALINLRKLVKKGTPLRTSWPSYRLILQDCQPLFQECLALTQGALVRKEGLDDGLCKIADAFLDDLSYRTDIPWGRFTILAENEFFTHMAQVIRLKFPETSVWNLPVCAHEFGHYIGPKLEIQDADGMSSHPFQKIVSDEGARLGEKYSRFAHEYFADLFATFALGPAYACTCILMRFDPARAHEEGPYHPSAARRAYWILKVLEKMNQANVGAAARFGGIIQHLERVWREGLKATDQPESIGKDVTVPIDGLLRKLYRLVDDSWPEVRYNGWSRARELSSQILTDDEPAQLLTARDRLPDVLNAAWRCRLEQKGEDVDLMVRKIGVRTVRFCNYVVEAVGMTNE